MSTRQSTERRAINAERRENERARTLSRRCARHSKLEADYNPRTGRIRHAELHVQ